MNHTDDHSTSDDNTIAPLPGEPGIPNVAQRHRTPMSRKGLLAVGLFVLMLGTVSALSIQRFVASGKKADDGEVKRAADRPAAATADPRKLELPATTTATAATPSAAPAPRIPALIPTAQEAEPIGVRRTGPRAQATTGSKPVSPEDAPVMLVTSRPAAATVGRPIAPMKAIESVHAINDDGQAPPASSGAL